MLARRKVAVITIFSYTDEPSNVIDKLLLMFGLRTSDPAPIQKYYSSLAFLTVFQVGWWGRRVIKHNHEMIFLWCWVLPLAARVNSSNICLFYNHFSEQKSCVVCSSCEQYSLDVTVEMLGNGVAMDVGHIRSGNRNAIIVEYTLSKHAWNRKPIMALKVCQVEWGVLTIR